MREFPQTSFVLHPLDYVIPLAIVVWIVLAVLLLRTNRKANSGDTFVWIVAGLVLTPMFYATGESDWELREFREFALYALWSVVVAMCIISWVKVVRDNEGRPSPIAVLAIVASIVCSLLAVAPALQRGRETVTRHTCETNLHQIGIGLDSYHEELGTWPMQQAGEPPHSWRVALLPYIYEDDVYAQYDFTAAWDDHANRNVMTSYVRPYVCPYMDYAGDDRPVMTSYALLVGDHAAWTSLSVIDPDDIPDGSGNTAIVAEACGLGIIWTEPRDIDLATTPIGINLPGDAPGHSPGILSTYHAKGANVLMADGSVRSLVIETDPSVLEAMLTADGGEPAPF